MPKYNIAILDDHPIVLQGILSGFKKYSLLFEPKSFTESEIFLKHAMANSIDLLLTDLSMPNVDGYEIIKKIKLMQPKLKVAVFTQHDGEGYFKDAYMLGVNGYILKSEEPEFLPEILLRILNGEFFVSRPIYHYLQTVGNTKILDSFEHNIIKLLVEGNTIQDISKNLGRSTKVIEYRLRKIKIIFSAKNNVELVYKLKMEYFK